MTHRGGLSLSNIIWRIGGGGPTLFLPWGPENSLGGPDCKPYNFIYKKRGLG